MNCTTTAIIYDPNMGLKLISNWKVDGLSLRWKEGGCVIEVRKGLKLCSLKWAPPGESNFIRRNNFWAVGESRLSFGQIEGQKPLFQHQSQCSLVPWLF